MKHRPKKVSRAHVKGLLLFGYPGSGKGTQGHILSALPGFHHVAMGDILRGLTDKNPLYDRVHSHLREGDLVPDDLAMDLFFHYVDALRPALDDFLVLDGVPRNKQQVDLLNQKVEVIRIFKLSVYDETLVIDRMRKRAKAQNRPDDASDEVIQHRLGIYRSETESCVPSADKCPFRPAPGARDCPRTPISSVNLAVIGVR